MFAPDTFRGIPPHPPEGRSPLRTARVPARRAARRAAATVRTGWCSSGGSRSRDRAANEGCSQSREEQRRRGGTDKEDEESADSEGPREPSSSAEYQAG